MRRHEADAVSLVFGLLFLGLAVAWALASANVVDIRDLRFAAPVALVVAGAIGFAMSLRRGHRESDETGELTSDEWQPPLPPDDLRAQ